MSSMKDNDLEYELAVVIVNFGMGSKVLKLAKHHGIHGGAVFLGKGTAKNRILEFLELTDIRKEIVFLGGDEAVIDTAVKAMDKEFEFRKPYHGIAFTMPMPALLRAGKHDYNYSSRREANIMYNSIISVVDKGKAELVMEAATEAGARGGTIIKARGAGMYETGKLFNMEIEPEKEIVVILSDTASTEKIAESICSRLDIGNGGNGVIFCQDVNKTYGMS